MTSKPIPRNTAKEEEFRVKLSVTNEFMERPPNGRNGRYDLLMKEIEGALRDVKKEMLRWAMKEGILEYKDA